MSNWKRSIVKVMLYVVIGTIAAIYWLFEKIVYKEVEHEVRNRDQKNQHGSR